MKIKQWEDKNLAQFSYAILSECDKEIILIDPSRDAEKYLEYAREHDARIKGIIETHPHADFVSSHLELHEQTGATIYISKLVNVSYPHQSFDEGDILQMGKITLRSLHTPGHSPDSICILVTHESGKQAIFTGDTLFIGDCGRPDLREGAGNIQMKREQLAREMYHSLRNKLMTLDDEVVVYPAHGAGTLCGKNLKEASSSTIGEEKRTNWSMQPMSEDEFVEQLLKEQPFIPAYFPFNVELNRKGAPVFRDAVRRVRIGKAVTTSADAERLDKTVWIVDARDKTKYNQQHLPNSVNLMEGTKFETWLGTLIRPGEMFYLAAESEKQLKALIERAAAIGYESFIKEAFVLDYGTVNVQELDMDDFRNNVDEYTIIDVRNPSETRHGKIFQDSYTIPLSDLRVRINEIPANKPVVVHCAGGYRSAAGSSLVRSLLNGKTPVFDLAEQVKEFEEKGKPVQATT